MWDENQQYSEGAGKVVMIVAGLGTAALLGAGVYLDDYSSLKEWCGFVAFLLIPWLLIVGFVYLILRLCGIRPAFKRKIMSDDKGASSGTSS